MKTEYSGNAGFLQRDSVEHEDYAEAYSTDSRETKEMDSADLLGKVLNRDNLNRAYKRVKANKGAAGVDGMTVDDALPWLKAYKGELLDSIRRGKYKPSPVRRVEIPKADGGVRKLGIPTVIDRIIQQAIAQVLVPIYEPKFSDGSYGYRPNRSAKDAIQKLKRLTSRSQGRKLDTVLNNIKVFMQGWLGYYGIAEMKSTMDNWNGWLRRRIRMYIWKQWKKPKTRVTNLKKLGMPDWMAYRNGNTRKGYWAVAGSGILTHTITNERLARRGYFDISAAYKSLHYL